MLNKRIESIDILRRFVIVLVVLNNTRHFSKVAAVISGSNLSDVLLNDQDFEYKQLGIYEFSL